MGIVAHPGEVTSLDVSFDGKYVFSAGGFDLSVNMWKINVEEHRKFRKGKAASTHDYNDEQSSLVGQSEKTAIHSKVTTEIAALKPYFGLLEGGENGELHRDIVDYFYYCQLRHHGEDSMEPRNLTGMIIMASTVDCFYFHHYYHFATQEKFHLMKYHRCFDRWVTTPQKMRFSTSSMKSATKTSLILARPKSS